MHINEAFPSKYVRASDLNGKDHLVVIATVEIESINPVERKLVMHFQGRQKGMVLNKTNATQIADLYGPNTNEWIGKEIVLFPTTVEFQRRMVEAIRVKPPIKRQTTTVREKYELSTGNGSQAVDELPDDFR